MPITTQGTSASRGLCSFCAAWALLSTLLQGQVSGASQWDSPHRRRCRSCLWLYGTAWRHPQCPCCTTVGLWSHLAAALHEGPPCLLHQSLHDAMQAGYVIARAQAPGSSSSSDTDAVATGMALRRTQRTHGHSRTRGSQGMHKVCTNSTFLRFPECHGAMQRGKFLPWQRVCLQTVRAVYILQRACLAYQQPCGALIAALRSGRSQRWGSDCVPSAAPTTPPARAVDGQRTQTPRACVAGDGPLHVSAVQSYHPNHTITAWKGRYRFIRKRRALPSDHR